MTTEAENFRLSVLSVSHTMIQLSFIFESPLAAAIPQLTCPLPFSHSCPSVARPRSRLRVLLINMEQRLRRCIPNMLPFCFCFSACFTTFFVVLLRTV
jgi:hypothetical protein